MSQKGKIEHNKKRLELIERYRAVRAELRAKARNVHLSHEQRLTARLKLQSLPRNSAENRYRNRCAITGRPRGFYRKFGLSRIKFRELALQGLIAGIRKSSW